MRKLAVGLLLANILVTIIFWWAHSGSLVTAGGGAGALIAFGRLFGLLAELAILLQLVLIGRVKFVERAFGFDKLNALHRKIGKWIGALIIFHPLLLTIGYASEHGVSLWTQFLDFFHNWHDVSDAVLGICILLAVVLISIKPVRKLMSYEAWHVLHLPIYVAIVLFFGHQVNTADVSYGAAFYYWYALNFAVFGALIFYRFLVPLLLYNKHKFRIEKLVPETPTVTSVYITGKNMSKFRFEAGQYVHAWFLSRGGWQPHPFSLSSAYNGKYIRLSIKASGDYTSNIPNFKPGTKVLLEGPFGRFTSRAARENHENKFLLIAGGIGITPIRSILEELHGNRGDAVLLYAARTEDELALKQELEKFDASKHYVIGRLESEKIISTVPDFRDREIYVCGPNQMMMGLVSLFQNLGVPKERIHYENFAY